MTAALSTMGVVTVPSAGVQLAAASHCERGPRRLSVLTCRLTFQACTPPYTDSALRGCTHCRLCE